MVIKIIDIPGPKLLQIGTVGSSARKKVRYVKRKYVKV